MPNDRRQTAPKTSMRPGVLLAVGMCVVLAVAVLVKRHKAPTRDQLATPPRASVLDKSDSKASGHGTTSHVGGWSASAGEASTSATHRASAPVGAAGARDLAGSREIGRGEAHGGDVGQVQRGAGGPGSTANTVGSGPISAGDGGSETDPGAGLGAGASAGLGTAAFGRRSPASGTDAPPNAAEGVLPVEPVQPAGGSTVVFNNAANKDLPTDKDLRVDNAANLIGQQAGGVSFWLTPQWEADDGSSGTLVRLGTGEVQKNSFAITKNGQSLQLTFADNSGTPLDIDTPIDGWQRDQRHLLTATWGRTVDGDGQVSFYVDGTLVGQQTYKGQFAVGQDAPLHIGADVESGQSLPGVFSNFQLYNRGLTPGELGQAPVLGGHGRSER